jgi:hypothetical protein
MTTLADRIYNAIVENDADAERAVRHLTRRGIVDEREIRDIIRAQPGLTVLQIMYTFRPQEPLEFIDAALHELVDTGRCIRGPYRPDKWFGYLQSVIKISK